MANADVKKLDKELFEYLKKTAGDFREFYSDKKTHVIHLDLKETIEQCWEEMARREGYSKIREKKKKAPITHRLSLNKEKMKS